MEVTIDKVKYMKVSEEKLKSECTSTEQYIDKLMHLRSSVTHWRCTEFNNFGATVGKVYKFFKDDFDGEFVVLDDNNENSMVWMCVEGDLLIKLK